MSEPIRWDAMSEDQRNELVAERVMGRTPMCSGALEIKKRVVPDRKGGIAFVFYTWKCPVCGLDKGGSLPPTENEHKNGASIPRYTTSMDAAWQAVEKMVDRIGYGKPDFDWNGPTFKSPTTHTSSYTNDGPHNHTGHLFYTKAGGDSGTLGETCWYVFMLLDGRYWWVFADTPHEAICLAALKACGVEVLTEPPTQDAGAALPAHSIAPADLPDERDRRDGIY